jgi:hypothetical protein
MRSGGFHPLRARLRHRNCRRGGIRCMATHRTRHAWVFCSHTRFWGAVWSKNQAMTTKKANRWVVAGLNRFLGSYSRASAAGVGYGSREGTASVLTLSWLVFPHVCLIFGSVCVRNAAKTTEGCQKMRTDGWWRGWTAFWTLTAAQVPQGLGTARERAR